MDELVWSESREGTSSAERRWVPATCVEVAGVGVKPDDRVMSMLDDSLIDLVDQVVPDFGLLRDIRTSTHKAKTIEQGVEIITKRALDQNFSAVIVKQTANSDTPVEILIAVLMSIESSERPQITLAETSVEFRKFLRVIT